MEGRSVLETPLEDYDRFTCESLSLGPFIRAYPALTTIVKPRGTPRHNP